MKNTFDFATILGSFGIAPTATVKPLGDGLINHTYVVETDGEPKYVLQQVNTDIFSNVEMLHDNIDKVTDTLRKAGKTTLHFLPSVSTGKTYIEHEGRTWRVMDYIADSRTISEVNPVTARMTGRAIGEFETLLAPIAEELGETLPRFHDMEYRLEQFEDAVARDAAGRVAELGEEIAYVRSNANRATEPERLYRAGVLPKRVCHCDTKVSNLLFTPDGSEVKAVIDLDTVMPSLVFSDMGDFMRTAACTTAEDEPDTNKIAFRREIYDAAMEGYLETATFLSADERRLLPTAPWRFAYMQAVRFLTDYINGDTYYRTAYPGHNLVRTRAQIALAKSI
ncbi:MAG: aminoglycoside phosphotransferase family protein [Muribaculaceae bacterium]|nr:aminoglycoside phosphotransferase family protein [Muribaculaceae bacterium]